jgi:hypothetical protein
MIEIAERIAQGKLTLSDSVAYLASSNQPQGTAEVSSAQTLADLDQHVRRDLERGLRYSLEQLAAGAAIDQVVGALEMLLALNRQKAEAGA